MIARRIKLTEEALALVARATQLLNDSNSIRLTDSRFVVGEGEPVRDAIALRSAVRSSLSALTEEWERRNSVQHGAKGARFIRVGLRCGGGRGNYIAFVPTEEIPHPYITMDLYNTVRKVLCAKDGEEILADSVGDVVVVEGGKIVLTIRGGK